MTMENGRILISTKLLAQELNRIDFNKGVFVTKILMNDDHIFIETSEKKRISINVEIIRYAGEIIQHNARWDWVKRQMNKVDEQPVSLSLRKNRVTIIYDY
jgi:hypothetical protein